MTPVHPICAADPAALDELVEEVCALVAVATREVDEDAGRVALWLVVEPAATELEPAAEVVATGAEADEVDPAGVLTEDPAAADEDDPPAELEPGPWAPRQLESELGWTVTAAINKAPLI